jgi:predicted Fe-Mo cluster-binding NifX family protein
MMSEYNEYFTAPSFVVVTIRGGKVRNVFGPFDSREKRGRHSGVARIAPSRW